MAGSSVLFVCAGQVEGRGRGALLGTTRLPFQKVHD